MHAGAAGRALFEAVVRAGLVRDGRRVALDELEAVEVLLVVVVLFQLFPRARLHREQQFVRAKIYGVLWAQKPEVDHVAVEEVLVVALVVEHPETLRYFAGVVVEDGEEFLQEDFEIRREMVGFFGVVNVLQVLRLQKFEVIFIAKFAARGDTYVLVLELIEVRKADFDFAHAADVDHSLVKLVHDFCDPAVKRVINAFEIDAVHYIFHADFLLLQGEDAV